MTRACAIALALLLGGCFDGDQAPTGSINACATNLYPNYSPKDLHQCVEVCLKCDRGITTTCTTSCTLKGAR